LREETISALNNLTTIKMKEERAKVFVKLAGLEPKHLAKFGATYCYLPLIMANLVGLIKIEDQGVRDAAAAFLHEYLSS
jgi:hypothetical protein